MAKKRPLLMEANARRRLEWCIQNRNKPPEFWLSIIFSDEASIERGAGHRRSWTFRYPGEKLDTNKVDTYNKSKGLRVMVWAAITLTEKTELIIMRRDQTTLKKGYTSNSYLDVLDEALHTIYTLERRFQQDNAPVHTAIKVRRYFSSKGVVLLDWWPAYSPDLNPIEHLWSYLKKRLYELYPDVELWKGSDDDITKRMESALFEAWRSIDDGVVAACVNSMRSRIEACIAADGWYTKY